MGAARTGGRSFTNRASYFEPRIEYGGESRKLDHRLHLGRWQYPNSATAAVVTLPVKCVVVRGGLLGSLSSSGAPKGRRIAAGKIEAGVVWTERVEGAGKRGIDSGSRRRDQFLTAVQRRVAGSRLPSKSKSILVTDAVRSRPSPSISARYWVRRRKVSRRRRPGANTGEYRATREWRISMPHISRPAHLPSRVKKSSRT